MAELGETQDPTQLVEGKPEAIEENARVLAARAERANWAAEGLQDIDTGAWEGPGADAFHEKFSYEPAKWFDAADALQAGGDALTDYASTLRWAQAQATEAVAQWNQGQAATQQAQAAHDTAAAQAAAQNQSAPPFTDPGEASRQTARDILNRARAQLSEVGQLTAATLRAKTQDAPEEPDWLDDLGHFMQDVGTHIVNDLASLGNAAIHNPQDLVDGLIGLGLTVASSAGIAGGAALTAVPGGAVVGLPVIGLSVAGEVAGAGMIVASVGDLASHASGDDRVEPMTTSEQDAQAAEQHKQEIGMDPATGQYRPGEAETGLRVEQQRGVTLSRYPESEGPDWIGSDGKTYDAVGNFPGKFFDQQWDQLKFRIEQHVGKADYVPVDVSQFAPEQIARVREYIQRFGDRVFVVGD